jgi:hypothetical protein
VALRTVSSSVAPESRERVVSLWEEEELVVFIHGRHDSVYFL